MTDRAARVLLCGAGTGGHLYPGIAVAQELRRRRPEAHVVFAGTGRALETREVARHGFDHAEVRSAGLKRKSVGALVRGLALLPLSVWDAWRVLSRVRPDLVIGLGGYSSGAVVLMAACRGTPTLLLEQNALPGMTNRLLARVVTAAAVSHDAALPYFRGKAFVSGNPVRVGFFESTPESRTGGRARLLVIGGSQGAHAINVAMIDAARAFASRAGTLAVTHQTGERDCAEVRHAYELARLEARVEPFFEEMVELMGEADLVVCRAGATTLAELASVGRPALLIPLPGAADDHQRVNAQVLARHGAGELLPQPELSGETLAARVLALIDDGPRRLRMAEAARTLASPDAARLIVDRAERLARW
jgi:UDP-N-acetylglucosamine--N-acetylmuramyl-(pentapeptide) pyrophosphoryl-undecaprenol N-acetylglucosamine transferase